MSEKGYAVLNAFLKQFSGDYIDQVIGAKDLHVTEDYYEEIKQVCLNNNIKFVHRKENYTINTAVSIVISWQWLIHHDSKIIIIHDSILPKYRGFAPLVNALINGEKEIGATALIANAEFDKGDIISQKRISIQYPIKIKDAIKIIAELYVQLVLEIASKIIAGNQLTQTKQNESEATYSLWRDERDYKLDWNDSSEKLKRMIDSLSAPYNGALTEINLVPARITDAELVEDVVVENRTPGKVLFMANAYPIVVCGKGLLKITAGYFESDHSSILPLTKFRTRFS